MAVSRHELGPVHKVSRKLVCKSKALGQTGRSRDIGRSGDLPRLLQESEKFHYQLLIPQSSTRLLAHSDCRLFVRKGRLIGTSGAKRVINIHDLKNARKQRDLVTS